MEKSFTPELVDAAWSAAHVANEAYGLDQDLHERAAAIAAPMMGVNTEPHRSFNGQPPEFHYRKLKREDMSPYDYLPTMTIATIEDSPFASKAVHEQSQRIRAGRQAASELSAERREVRNQHAETLFGFIADYVKDVKKFDAMDETARQSLASRKDSIDALVEKAQNGRFGYLHPNKQTVTLQRLGLIEGEPTSIDAIAKKYKISAEKVKRFSEEGKEELLTDYLSNL
jgi:hypothetical protein